MEAEKTHNNITCILQFFRCC